MGGHKRANVRGRTRKLTEGDKLARDVHGRKGMCKERREKGAGVKPLPGDRAEDGDELDQREWTILNYLSMNQVYSTPGMTLEELKWFLIDEGADPEADPMALVKPIIDGIRRRKPGWMCHILGLGVHLDPAHREEIREYVKKRRKELLSRQER